MRTPHELIGGLDPEPEEGEERLEEHDGRDREARVDDHGPEDVRDHVPEDDPPAAEAQRARRLDELHALNGQHLAPDDARHREPFDGAYREEEQEDVPAEEHHQQDDEDREGQRIEDVDQPHHERVHLAPDVARHRAVGDADRQRDEGGDEPHHQGDPPAVEGAGEEVPAEGVGPQPVLARRRDGAEVEVLLLVGLGEERARGAGERQGEEQDPAGERPRRLRRSLCQASLQRECPRSVPSGFTRT